MAGPSNVIGNSTDLDKENDDVSIPYKSHHYRWQCQLPSQLTDFPLSVNSFLDSGAHVVLIHPDTATNLGQKLFTLLKPLPIDVTLKDHERYMDTTLLHEYIRIQPVSIDGYWTSNVVKAVLCPNLCVLLLLGLPFLERNHILIDFEERTCIDKTTKYDLLNPVVPKPKCPKPLLKERKSGNTNNDLVGGNCTKRIHFFSAI